MPKSKSSKSSQSSSNKICARGIRTAKRKFKVYPSAYANMYASRVCKDPNFPKRGSKKK